MGIYILYIAPSGEEKSWILPSDLCRTYYCVCTSKCKKKCWRKILQPTTTNNDEFILLFLSREMRVGLLSFFFFMKIAFNFLQTNINFSNWYYGWKDYLSVSLLLWSGIRKWLQMILDRFTMERDWCACSSVYKDQRFGSTRRHHTSLEQKAV